MSRILCLVLVVLLSTVCQADPSADTLSRTVPKFAVADLPLSRAVAKLAANEGLSLGIESVGRAEVRDGVTRSGVTLTVEGKTVREILDALVAQDSRYAYLVHGEWINLVPKDKLSDPNYPLNRHVSGEVTFSTDGFLPSPPAVKEWLDENKISFALLHIGTIPAKKLTVEPQTVALTNPTYRECLNWGGKLLGYNTWSLSEPMKRGDGGTYFIMSRGVLPSKDVLDRNAAAARAKTVGESEANIETAGGQ